MTVSTPNLDQLLKDVSTDFRKTIQELVREQSATTIHQINVYGKYPSDDGYDDVTCALDILNFLILVDYEEDQKGFVRWITDLEGVDDCLLVQACDAPCKRLSVIQSELHNMEDAK